MTRLSNQTLQELPEGVKIPSYDRKALAPGIVHIGLGNFHRAHQAWYLHRLMQGGMAQDWAIIGAGVRPYDVTLREKLLAQDCLSTLIALSPENTASEVIGSIIDYLPIKDDNHPLIEKIADSSIRIVSLTVTESGYFIDSASQNFDANHPDIQHDVAHPHRPRTVFGAIIEAIRIRRAKNIGPVTVQSCDNLCGNGSMTQHVVVSLARLSNPSLADWIESNCSFPNSMVDCIVPATAAKELEMVNAIGIDDAVPVTHENFRQWVIEDNFCAGRPDWDKVGAVFASSIHDFETMKIRILNAGHQILANAGEILGIETIADCMAHPLISKVFQKIAHEEIAPYIAPVTGMTPAAYIRLIVSRFSNTAIHDTTRRVAFDGSSRHPGFLFPSLRDGLKAGGPINGLSLAEALWARMCVGRREDGSIIENNDPNWPQLTRVAKLAQKRPTAWLEQAEIYGDLVAHSGFVRAFSHWTKVLETDSCNAALAAYVNDDQVNNTGAAR